MDANIYKCFKAVLIIATFLFLSSIVVDGAYLNFVLNCVYIVDVWYNFKVCIATKFLFFYLKSVLYKKYKDVLMIYFRSKILRA